MGVLSRIGKGLGFIGAFIPGVGTAVAGVGGVLGKLDPDDPEALVPEPRRLAFFAFGPMWGIPRLARDWPTNNKGFVPVRIYNEIIDDWQDRIDGFGAREPDFFYIDSRPWIEWVDDEAHKYSRTLLPLYANLGAIDRKVLTSAILTAIQPKFTPMNPLTEPLTKFRQAGIFRNKSGGNGLGQVPNKIASDWKRLSKIRNEFLLVRGTEARLLHDKWLIYMEGQDAQWESERERWIDWLEERLIQQQLAEIAAEQAALFEAQYRSLLSAAPPIAALPSASTSIAPQAQPQAAQAGFVAVSPSPLVVASPDLAGQMRKKANTGFKLALAIGVAGVTVLILSQLASRKLAFRGVKDLSAIFGTAKEGLT